MSTPQEKITERIDKIEAQAAELTQARAEYRSIGNIAEQAKKLQAQRNLGRRAATELVVCLAKEKVRLAELPFKYPEQTYNFGRTPS